MELYKRGSRGEVVKQIQRALHLYPDGIFGKLTEEAVIMYQREHGLTPDGVVGPATLAKLLPAVTASAFNLKRSSRTIREIIVHCTATPEGRDYTVDQIRKDHLARGFSDIGYHYVIYRDGSVHNGRDVNISGAHCTNHNAHSIGVSYVGGVENIPGVAYDKLKPKDTRTASQRMSMLALLKELRKLYPNAKIYGHRDFASKACPSFDAKKEYKDI